MHSRHASVQHARLVNEVVSGHRAAQGLDSRIRESWQRCLSSYKLNPSRERQPTFVSSGDLRQRRERSALLYSIARVEMASLARLLNAPVGVMLTDEEGVILGYTGAPDFADVARSSGLCEGAVWSEIEQGTNGMGTCLATREPVLVEEESHFLFANAALTCCGAPILDGHGNVIGALNISGRLRLSAAPTLALARLAVQNIENRVLLTQHHRHHLLRFHPHREFIATAGEGILAIDDRGRVTAANPAAVDWLGLASHDSLRGQPVERLLGLNCGRLEALGSDPALAKPLPPRGRGSFCYAIIQPPLGLASAPEAGVTPRCCANGLEQAEHKFLRAALERCGWNVSLAAERLKISRRTLHRKLKSHGLRRYSVWEGDFGH